MATFGQGAGYEEVLMVDIEQRDDETIANEGLDLKSEYISEWEASA